MIACAVVCAMQTAAPAAADTRGACDRLFAYETDGADRTILDPNDLIELREIGENSGASATGQAFSVSPSGRQLAFQLRQANVAANSYCQAIVTLDLTNSDLRVIDTGGDVITSSLSFWGLEGYPTGAIYPIVPLWSPDGRWIAYLKRVDGRTQIWRAGARGGRPEMLTRSAADVERFAWSADGREIFYAARPQLNAANGAIDAEALSGYHFDERSMPMAGARPFPLGPIATEYFAIDVRGGRERRAADTEAVSIPADPRTPRTTDAVQNLRVALQAPARPPYRASNIVVTTGDTTRDCAHESCASDIVELWFSADGEDVYFLRREGWANEETALYAWRHARNDLRRISSGRDMLSACRPSADGILCVHEASNQPRRIVRVDLESGDLHTVFDPNPNFSARVSSNVERLHWRNDRGIETIGDLVLPRDYAPGAQLPLVVVQYVTRGLLRGGVGDEYPIQAFADRGFAVLSFQRPADVASISDAADWTSFLRANYTDWADRRSVHSALETGIEILIDRGVVDRQRIGITGLSDGASTVQFALVRAPHLFAAAAMSTCCQDPSTHTLLTGPRTAATFQSFGFPRHSEDADLFWAPYSIARNAERIATPLLLQLAEDEYLTALETYTSLREHDRPVEMYVFPGARHVKLSPAQRAAIYARNLDWFDFWLNDQPSPSSERSDWTRLRALSPDGLSNGVARP